MTHAGHRAYKKVDQRNRPCDLLVPGHEIAKLSRIFDLSWLCGNFCIATHYFW